MLLRALILLCLLFSNVYGQIPTKAIFSFLEGGPFEVLPGETKIVNLPTANGVAQFEMGLIESGEDSVGLVSHYNLYGRNLGDIGQLGHPDQAVHPIEVLIVYDSKISLVNTEYSIYDRNHRIPARIQLGNRVYGFRDAWLQEPTASAILPDGKVIFWALDRRAPPNGFAPYYALYQTAINGTPGEDPLSLTNHRWQGGFMKLWDFFVVKPGYEILIENDPMPESVMDSWYLMARALPKDIRGEYPPRFQAIMNSLDRLNVNNGIPYDPPNNRSMLWWIFQAENRFRYWEEHNDYTETIGAQSHQVGWKDWMDLRWVEGHYNNGFNWNTIIFRQWLNTRSHVAWWIFTRLSKWDSTSGICWSSSVNNGVRTPLFFGGLRWYEKGFYRSPSEVGCDYWPINYKQYSEAILMSHVVNNKWWTKDAMIFHGSQLPNMGYQTWPGIYGERIPAWGIMNAIAYYRLTKDQKWIDLANSIATNVLNIMKSPAKLNAELEPEWRDPVLGVPYVLDHTAINTYEFAAWQVGKFGQALVHLAIYGQQTQYNDKIKQIARFLIQECSIEAGNMIVGFSEMDSSRVPATYLNNYITFNKPNPAATDWFIWPIAYSAAILGDSLCRSKLPNMINQMGEFLEWEPRYSLNYYEVGAGTLIGNTLNIRNINLSGLDSVKHRVRLQSSDGSARIYSFSMLGDNILTLNGSNIFPEGEYVVTITGPRVHLVYSTLDRAVRSISVDVSNKPPSNRIFSWDHGMHPTNWQKMVIMPLTQGDLPFLANNLLK